VEGGKLEEGRSCGGIALEKVAFANLPHEQPCGRHHTSFSRPSDASRHSYTRSSGSRPSSPRGGRRPAASALFAPSKQATASRTLARLRAPPTRFLAHEQGAACSPVRLRTGKVFKGLLVLPGRRLPGATTQTAHHMSMHARAVHSTAPTGARRALAAPSAASQPRVHNHARTSPAAPSAAGRTPSSPVATAPPSAAMALLTSVVTAIGVTVPGDGAERVGGRVTG